MKSDYKSIGIEALCRAKATHSPKEAIQSLCLEVISELGILKPPIPLKPIMKFLGINFNMSRTSKEAHFWRGLTHATANLKYNHTEKKFEIILHNNQNRNWRRERFTLAHEIIHVLIIRALNNSKLIESLNSTKEAHIELENLCDFGASELLMPSFLVRKAIGNDNLSPEKLLYLYDEFLVSQTALICKIASLEAKTSIIKWRISKDKDETLCFSVDFCYPRYMSNFDSPWLPIHTTTKHLNPDIVNEVFISQKPKYDKEVTIKLGKRSWNCTSTVTFFENIGRDVQPEFDGFSIPDESYWSHSKNSVLLFSTQNFMIAP
jgi:Zn-dependent peptidase ImmA (M78 family)